MYLEKGKASNVVNVLCKILNFQITDTCGFLMSNKALFICFLPILKM